MGKSFCVINAEGSHYDVGFQIGTKSKEDAVHLVRSFRETTKSTSLEQALLESRKYLPYAFEFYPGYIEEIRGYADGAGVKFDEIIGALFSSRHGGCGCTDVVASERVTTDRSVLVAHNSDWYLQDSKHVCLVRVKVGGEPEFMAITFGGIVPEAGLNVHGISITGNWVYPNDTRVGIPKTFPVRKILAATSLGEAIRASIPSHRASSYNNIICNSDGEIYSIEGSATDFDAIYGTDGYLVHTNHYISERMKKYEEDPSARVNSIIRYNRAITLLRNQLGQVTTYSIMKIMSDHLDYPSSICRHFDEKTPVRNDIVTLFSVIIDPARLTMWISHGNPCSQTYAKYQLRTTS